MNVAESEFERIVRALAAIQDPTVDDRDYSPWSQCGLCGVTDPAGYVHEIDDPLKHEESCPWRMARLLVRDDHSDGTMS